MQLTIKDQYLHPIQRQAPLYAPTDSSREIAEAAYAILKREWNGKTPIRMLTVTVTGLTDEDAPVQLDLFSSEECNENRSKRDKAIDKIRQKYGSNSIVTGSVVKTDIGVYKK